AAVLTGLAVLIDTAALRELCLEALAGTYPDFVLLGLVYLESYIINHGSLERIVEDGKYSNFKCYKMEGKGKVYYKASPFNDD
ncbi:hypothetical protein Tco_0189437, partial [Tanacetum coccineum]